MGINDQDLILAQIKLFEMVVPLVEHNLFSTNYIQLIFIREQEKYGRQNVSDNFYILEVDIKDKI